MDRTAALEEIATQLIAQGHHSFVTPDGEVGTITSRRVSVLPGCAYLAVTVSIGDERHTFDIVEKSEHRGAPIFCLALTA